MPSSKAQLSVVESAQSTVHIGNVLLAHRRSARLSQERAAVAAGISRNALAALEKRRFPDPHLSTLLSLMLAYGLTSVEALLGAVPSTSLASEWAAEDWVGGTPIRPATNDPKVRSRVKDA